MSTGVSGELAASVSKAQSTTNPEKQKKIVAAAANLVAIENLALQKICKKLPPKCIFMSILYHSNRERQNAIFSYTFKTVTY